MILTLEFAPSHRAGLGDGGRQTFGPEGGTIGRHPTATWVLPDPKVSGQHAVITADDRVFYIEDTSRNGVFLNSRSNRLARGRSYPLKAGDRLFIDPYEIVVSVSQGARPAIANDDPFADADPFGPDPMAELGIDPVGEADQRLDPLDLLNLRNTPPPRPRPPLARDLAAGDPLASAYTPPAAVPDPQLDPFGGGDDEIPPGFDPLLHDDPTPIRRPSFSPPRPAARPLPPPPPAPSVPAIPAAPPPSPRTPVSRVEAPSPGFSSPSDVTALGAVLEGAGLAANLATPELGRQLGQILRVVVEGVMAIMASRGEVKDEFGVRRTQFRPAENNPLKFSANVDDALHNLLVKRNPAYLGPVAAFEDAFADLTHHQVAMLAGVRTAFEAMIGAFAPERLEQDFDRQKGIVPGKLRYWDLYCERMQSLSRDPEATFRRLFGDEFARAYAEQLAQLQAQAPAAARRAGRHPGPVAPAGEDGETP